MRRVADADQFPCPIVFPAPQPRERARRADRASGFRLRPLFAVPLAATVLATIGGAALTFGRPVDQAVARAAVRELLIVAQPGLAGDPGVASPSPSPTRRRPVAGLSQAAMDNAVAIVETGKRMNLPRRAYVIAIMTALQETMLRNLANATVPASLNHRHQGVERNYDSVGLFQQRPSQGWGTVAQLMDPATASRLFYNRLVKVDGWQSMSPAAAAQAVQRSAFPDEYAKHQRKAEQIVNAIV
jgi:hypothetical protein